MLFITFLFIISFLDNLIETNYLYFIIIIKKANNIFYFI